MDKEIGDVWKDYGPFRCYHKKPWCVMGNNGKVIRYKHKWQAVDRSKFFKTVRVALHG